MDINQNLEQINTFEKGMNTDTSDIMLPNNQYRYAENLRFTSHDTGNSGELLPIRDMNLIFNIGEEIVATTQIRDYGIFITKSNAGWSVYTVLNKSLKKQKIFGPCTESLGDTISLVTRWETDKDVKLYIADGKHLLMFINILHDDYDKSGLPPTNIEYILSSNKVILPQIIANISENPGSLKPAVLLYTYRLYREGGSISDIAPLSGLIRITDDDSQGYPQESTSDKSVDLTIDVETTHGFNKIQIIRITYAYSGYEPDIKVIYDDEFSGHLEYNDTGIDITTLSSLEFRESVTYDKIIPKVIESKGDYLFAANILDEQDETEAQWSDINILDYITITPTQLDSYKYELNFKGDVISGNITPSLRAGETYRYGIILYDEAGRKSTVKWIGDITPPETMDVVDVLQDRYVINPIGVDIRFKKRIPNCDRYEILRCIRGVDQSHVLYLGIAGFPLGINNNIFTNVFLSDSRFEGCYKPSVDSSKHDQKAHYKTIQDALIFACPEAVYLPTETDFILKNRNISILNYRNYKANIDSNQFQHEEIHEWDHSVALVGDTTALGALWSVRIGKYGGIDNANGMNAGMYMFFVLNENADEYKLIPDKEELFKFNPFFPDISEENKLFKRYLDDRKNFVDKGRDPVYTADPYGDVWLKNEEHERTTSIQFAYIHPTLRSNLYEDSAEIIGYNTADSFKPYDNMMSDTSNWDDVYFTGADDYTYVIGTYTYRNWYLATGIDEDAQYIKPWGKTDETAGFKIFPGGKSIIFKLNKKLDDRNRDTNLEKFFTFPWAPTPTTRMKTKEQFVDIDADYSDVFRINIKNVINNDYTGYPSDKTLSSFYSFGNIFENEKDSFVYDGDTYVNVFIYNNTHACHQPFQNESSACVIYAVPIQSSINLLDTHGDIITRIQSLYNYLYLDYAGEILKYSQEKDAYLYNAAYSAVPDLITYNPIVYTDVYSKLFDARIKVSEQKNNGETIDSWAHFKSTSTMDVDTRFGQITHMRLFKDYLVFWQESATGIISTNERVLVQDIDDTSVLLGTGGVLLRYDYLTTIYGMQFYNIAETYSNTTLYWWDSYKREIIGYSGGQLILPMAEVKTIRSYINNHKNSKNPCFVYDNKHNEILMSAVQSMPLVYNEFTLLFTSVYDYNFEHFVQFADTFWLSYNKNVYENNGEYIEGYLTYVVNKDSLYVKVFDNVRFAVNIISNMYPIDIAFNLPDKPSINNLLFRFKSPQQYSETQVQITNREYDYRFAIPRAQVKQKNVWKLPIYGQRMRGKYMITDLTIPPHSNSSNNTMSLQYIITKFRISYA